jgi:hypothetical protein
VRRLGAASPGGLALPDASPTADHMYAPRGVWTDGTRVVVADSGNHRVLIWHTFPDRDGAPADVVLGQADFGREGPAAGGDDTRRGLNLPTGVGVVDDKLLVADAWHHRLLVWDGLPRDSYAVPDAVIGQPDLDRVQPNRGGKPAADTFYWPFGFADVAGVFWVADTGNRRVLGWRAGLPLDARPADIVLGQPDATTREDNSGGLSASTFRWPHAFAGDDRTLFVADAGDHRVLGFTPPGAQRASLVLGQASTGVSEEFKNRPQGADRLRFPYAVVGDSRRLIAADTSNNRVLLWHDVPGSGAGVPADTVLGQRDFDANGENRWDEVADDSLCWPYGLSMSGDLLAVADSGNNRVVFWQVEA